MILRLKVANHINTQQITRGSDSSDSRVVYYQMGRLVCLQIKVTNQFHKSTLRIINSAEDSRIDAMECVSLTFARAAI